MAPHKYISQAVLFDDEEEWNKSTTRYDVSGRLRNLQERKEQVLDNTLEATRSALMLLKDAEDTGIKAAAELDRQGEVLSRANDNLEQMDVQLKESNRNISSIKSVFKSFKNRITGKSKKLRREMKKSKTDRTSDKSTKPNKATYFQNVPSLQVNYPSVSTDKNELIEQDLSEIAASVSRLKNFGVAMAHATDAQNDLLDRMYFKTEGCSSQVSGQTKQINKLIN